jgi:hypothetical protein
MKPITRSLPKILGEGWIVPAVECTDKARFLSDNAGVIARLATNVERCGAGPQEAVKAAESHLIAFRALCCRCSALPPDFRPWTRAEKMKAIAAQNDIKPKEILEWLGRDASTEKADRKRIYFASTSEGIGRRWTNTEEPAHTYFHACLEFWTTSPNASLPPLCLMSISAMEAIFKHGEFTPDAIRKTINDAGLYRPRDFRLTLRNGYFVRHFRGQNFS